MDRLARILKAGVLNATRHFPSNKQKDIQGWMSLKYMLS